MAKELLNEAERYLLKNWVDARLLEESMEGVRTKYSELFDCVIDAVTKEHPELDARRSAVTQFYGVGYLGFGRKIWPGGESTWPTGLWVNNLRLEVLTADDSESPFAYIEFSNKSKSELDFNVARQAVNAAAKEVLTPDERKNIASATEKGVLLWLPAPSKRQLLDALADGDGEGFVQIFVAQFDMMAKFVPVLDKVFSECLVKE